VAQRDTPALPQASAPWRARQGAAKRRGGRRARLRKELVDLVADRVDLALELLAVRGEDRAGDDGARDAARAAERGAGGHEDVGDVLVLAEEGQVEDNGERVGVAGEDDELRDGAVERLDGLVSALLELLVRSSLLDELENGGGEGRVGKGEDLGVGGLNDLGLNLVLLVLLLLLVLFLLLSGELNHLLGGVILSDLVVGALLLLLLLVLLVLLVGLRLLGRSQPRRHDARCTKEIRNEDGAGKTKMSTTL